MRQHRDLHPIYLSSWWNRKYATGTGLACVTHSIVASRSPEDGSAFTMVSWTAGAQRPREFFDEEIKFIGGLDFAKLIGW
jgi:hypothetical protein